MSREPERDLPHVALSRHAHDRIADRRADSAWMQEVWSSPETRVMVIAGTRLRTDPLWVSPAQAPEGTRVLLGALGDVVHFAVIADPSTEGTFEPLRGALLALPTESLALVVHAVGIAEWLWDTRHCPRCGARLSPVQLGHVLRCDACDREEYPRTDPAVIMLVTHSDRALLGRSPAWPPGRYSTLAGFVEPGESMEDAVRREVHEETGVRVGRVRYFGSQPWPLPRSLMIGFLAEASSEDISVDGLEIESARWFTREEMESEASAGTLLLPSGISISRSLIEAWYGGPLPGSW